MGQLRKYSGSFAKVRACRRSLLGYDDYLQLLGKGSVAEIAAHLKHYTAYSAVLEHVSEEHIHRGQLEMLLRHGSEQALIRLIRFLNSESRKILKLYVLRKEIEILKQMLRMLESGRLQEFETDTDSYFYKYFSIDIARLKTSGDVASFVENLKDSPFYRLLAPLVEAREHLQLFKLEMVLDAFYYKTAWRVANKVLKGQDRELVCASLGSEIDMLNITWILRCKMYFNVPNEIIYSLMLPVYYKLPKALIIKMVECRAAEEIYAVLADTRYRRVFQQTDTYIGENRTFYTFRLQYRLAQQYPFSIMSVLSYVHLKEAEEENLIKIIEGVRYGIDMAEIKRYLVLKEGCGHGSCKDGAH